MKRLLIITPSFLPSTAADMHRARLLAPHALALGWEVEILCIDPRDNEAPLDPSLLAAFPDHIPIHRVRCPRQRWHRWMGRNSLYRRCRSALKSAGDRLLASRKFDLLYFSSTAFDTFTLGPRWRSRFAVPYVLDYQDPWRNDYYRRTGIRPPGGRLKFALVQAQAAWREPPTVRGAAGLTAVTPTYLNDLKARYQGLCQHLVLPFPADPAALPAVPLRVPCTWTAIGRGGEDLQPAARALASALRQLPEPVRSALGPIDLRFVGTSYASADRAVPTLIHCFADLGHQAVTVTEVATRIPLQETRRLQAESTWLVALLSDDPGYQPSKLAGLIWSGKPLILVAPATHRIHADFGQIEGVICLRTEPDASFSAQQMAALQRPGKPAWPATLLQEFDPVTHAKRLLGFFEHVLVAAP